MEEILAYQSVEVCFAGQAVVHDVSFSLHAGEILGIVGESGSGKSTILKACMGLLGNSGMVTRGDIWFQGRYIPDLSEGTQRVERKRNRHDFPRCRGFSLPDSYDWRPDL